MKSIGPVPVHAPGSAVSVWPSTGVPAAAGVPEVAGGSTATLAPGAEVAASSPAALVAVTSTTIAWPTSAPVRS